MNINYLRTFLVALETGSFSATARRLGLTQPAVSLQIQALEDYFGAKLVERQGRKLSLTRAGELAVKNITASLELVDTTRKAIDKLGSEVAGPVVIGASTVPGEHLCPLLIGNFVKRYPKVKPRLIVSNTAQVVARIERQELDFGLVGSPINEQSLLCEPVFQDELILLVHPMHHLATKERVTIDDVQGETFVGRIVGSGSRTFLEREFARHGLSLARLQTVLEVSTTLSAVNAVEAGLGIAFVSVYAAGLAVKMGTVVARRLDGLTFARALYLVSLPSRYGGRAVMELAKFFSSPEARAIVEGRRRDCLK